jgi:glyoxylase-like metal-dependent hydrolase (beta-lactamase superfamily II)
MISEIVPGFYHLDLPYPRTLLRTVNVYFARGSCRDLLIDTGIDVDGCRETLAHDLSELGVDLNKTDFFITHGHHDHFGQLAMLARESSTIYMTRLDAALMYNTPKMWEGRGDTAMKYGCPEIVIEHAVNHRHDDPVPSSDHRFHYLKQDDILTVGEFSFRCFETPGHSKGHMCLYEPEGKFLVAGDHILIDISPNISCWSDDENPLGSFLASLDKVYNLDVKITLPGHRRLIKDLKGRVDELKHHHELRANEALSILKKGRQNAYQIASQMTWDIPYPWDEVAIWQQFSATGETVAHLNYLINQGKVHREANGKQVLFTLR